MLFHKKGIVIVVLVLVLALVSLLYARGGITGAIVGTESLSLNNIALTTCGDLNATSTTYELQNYVVSTNYACFNIKNSSIVLDCHGFNITFGGGAASVGVNNSGGYNNITVKNCVLSVSCDGCDTSGFWGIDYQNSSNGTITNNTIKMLFISARGISLRNSSNNLVSYNNISSRRNSDFGIYLVNSSTANILVNNTIGMGSGVTGVGAFSIFDYSLGQNVLIYNNSFGSISWNKTNLTINFS
ncbi:MAG: right-handed parallel beta-helix repeat-containing protein, partial [Nanoarchaeota archaeon]